MNDRMRMDSVRSSNMVSWIQAGSSVVTFVFSVAVCISMALHQDQFKGHCLLFSTGEWQESDGQLKVDWASQAYCNYTIFVAVVLAVVAAVTGFRVLKWVFKGKDATFLAAFCDVVVSGLLCFMAFIAAMFVTLGFKAWCKQMTTRFSTCRDAEANDIDKKDGIDTSHFYLQMFTAQLGIWGAATSMLVNMIFSLVKLFRYHWLENLRVSMAKERRKLINEDMISEVHHNQAQHPQTSVASRRPDVSRARGLISRRRRTREAEEDEARFEEVKANEEVPAMVVSSVTATQQHQRGSAVPSEDASGIVGLNELPEADQSMDEEARVQLHQAPRDPDESSDMMSSIGSGSPKGNQIFTDDEGEASASGAAAAGGSAESEPSVKESSSASSKRIEGEKSNSEN